MLAGTKSNIIELLKYYWYFIADYNELHIIILYKDHIYIN